MHPTARIILVALMGMLPIFTPHAANDESSIATVLESVDRGDASAVSAWLEQQSDPEQWIGGESLMYRAARSGQLEIVALLIEAGLSPDAAVPQNRRPLMAAAYYGHLDVVTRLLDAGADPLADADNGYATFDYALEAGRDQIMQALLDRWLSADASAPERSSLALARAVVAADLAELDRLLSEDHSPNLHNRTGYAPLPLAVRLQRTAMVERLLAGGANPDIGNDGNDEALPLNQAARGGHLDLVTRLLEAGASPDRGNARGYTALMLAAGYGHAHLVQPLLAAGADPGRLNDEGFSAMDQAIQRGLVAAISALLEHWPPGNDTTLVERRRQALAAINGTAYPWPTLRESQAVPPWGYSHLALAARFGHLESLNALLEAGADPQQAGLTGYRTTPLIDASRGGHLAVAQALLAAGADVSQADGHGDPPINWATFYGHADVVDWLLSVGADPLQENRDGYSAVRTAREQGHGELLARLGSYLASRDRIDAVAVELATLEGEALRTTLAALPSVDQPGKDGLTLLQVAARSGLEEAVRRLIDAGADVNGIGHNRYRMSPLMAAVAGNRPELVSLLLEAGAEPDQVDRLGDPAINWATYYGRLPLVDRLLAAGADPDIRTRHGTALEIAYRRGHHPIIDRLENHAGFEPGALHRAIHSGDLALIRAEPADINSQDERGYSALMIAARDGQADQVRDLLDLGADPSVAASSERAMGMTALLLAAAEGHPEVLGLLLEAGARVDQPNAWGQTALQWAFGQGHAEAARALLGAGADPDHRDSDGRSPREIALQSGQAEVLESF